MPATAVTFCGARSNGKTSLKLPPVAFRTSDCCSFWVDVPSVGVLTATVLRSSPRRMLSVACALTDRWPVALTPTSELRTCLSVLPPPPNSSSSRSESCRLNGREIWTLVPTSKLKSSSPVAGS